MAYIFSASALLLSIVSFFAIFFYVKKRTAIDRIPTETRQAVTLIINEIERITDRDSELIEERVKKLKSLIEDVDRRIAAYERQAASYQTAEEIQKKLNEKKDAAAVETYRMLGRTYTARETSPLVISVTENPAARSGAAGPDEEERSHRAREAARLSAAGVPNNEIAKLLHITVNEVEMALFLRRHGGAGV
jgi:predicted transcriptional regulator